MKLISLNIELNRHHDLVLPFFEKENADVICMQEILEEDFEMFKKELKMDGILLLNNFVVDDIHTESYGKKDGIAIFAKNISNSGYMFHVGDKNKIDQTFEEYLKDSETKIKNRALLWIDTNIDDKVFRIVTSHLTITKEGEATPAQIEACDKFIKQIKTLGEFVFCGDINAPRGRETFDKIAKEFKDNIPKEYKTSIDPILHRAGALEYMVDGLFTTPQYITSNVELQSGLSDHMAIISNIEKLFNKI